MILLDVNVLVYAFKSTEALHEPTRSWLEETLRASADRVGLCESTVSGFVRIVTNPRVYSLPAPTGDAVAFIDAITSSERASWLPANEATWSVFRRLVGDDRQIKANLVPDAWLAALAISHGTRLATADRGFARG